MENHALASNVAGTVGFELLNFSNEHAEDQFTNKSNLANLNNEEPPLDKNKCRRQTNNARERLV